MRYLIIIAVIITLLACGDNGGCGRDGVRCTPELPPMPTASK